MTVAVVKVCAGSQPNNKKTTVLQSKMANFVKIRPKNRDIIMIAVCHKCRHRAADNMFQGTHEDERTVLYRTKSLDGTKLNTSPNTNPNSNINPNPKLTQILTLFSCFMLFSSTVP